MALVELGSACWIAAATALCWLEGNVASDSRSNIMDAVTDSFDVDIRTGMGVPQVSFRPNGTETRQLCGRNGAAFQETRCWPRASASGGSVPMRGSATERPSMES